MTTGASRPIALVPGVPALLPGNASLEDPVADLRAACREAVARMGGRVQVLAGSEPGRRVGRHLVRAAGAALWPDDLLPAERSVDADESPEDLVGPLWCGMSVLEEIGPPTGVVVVANGSAKRTEKAPGHLDQRAEAFDAGLGRALVVADAEALRSVDSALAGELWADVGALPALADLLGEASADVLFDAAPFGVQYWVIAYAPGRGADPSGAERQR